MENKSKFTVETFSTQIDHSAQSLSDESDFRVRVHARIKEEETTRYEQLLWY